MERQILGAMNPAIAARGLEENPQLQNIRELSIVQAGHREIGRRPTQQDFYGMGVLGTTEKPVATACLLADGFGDQGSAASETAVQQIFQRLQEPDFVTACENFRRMDEASQQAMMPRMQDLIVARVELVHQQMKERGLGEFTSTLVFSVLIGAVAFVGHVGDSRAYLGRASGPPLLLTEDHSVAWQDAAGQVTYPEGEYDPLIMNLPIARQARLEADRPVETSSGATHSAGNVIYKFMGRYTLDLDLHMAVVRLRPGDRIVLMSDGVWKPIQSEDRVIEILDDRTMNAPQTVQAFLAEAGAGRDNRCVVVQEYQEREEAASGLEEKWKEEVGRVMASVPARDVTAPWLTRLYPALEAVRQEMIRRQPEAARKALEYFCDKAMYVQENTPREDVTQTVRIVPGDSGGVMSRSTAIQLLLGIMLFLRGTGNNEERFPIDVSMGDPSKWFYFGENMDTAMEAMVNVLQLQRIALEAEGEPLPIVTPLQIIEPERLPYEGGLLSVADYFALLASLPVRREIFQYQLQKLGSIGIFRDFPPLAPADIEGLPFPQLLQELLSRNPLVQVHLSSPTDVRSPTLDKAELKDLDALFQQLYAAHGEAYVKPPPEVLARATSIEAYAREAFAANREVGQRVIQRAAVGLGRLVGTATGIGADVSGQLQPKDRVGITWANDFDDAVVPRPDATAFSGERAGEAIENMSLQAISDLRTLSRFISGDTALADQVVETFRQARQTSYRRVQQVIDKEGQQILHPEYVRVFQAWRDGEGRAALAAIGLEESLEQQLSSLADIPLNPAQIGQLRKRETIVTPVRGIDSRVSLIGVSAGAVPAALEGGRLVAVQPGLLPDGAETGLQRLGAVQPLRTDQDLQNLILQLSRMPTDAPKGLVLVDPQTAQKLRDALAEMGSQWQEPVVIVGIQPGMLRNVNPNSVLVYLLNLLAQAADVPGRQIQLLEATFTLELERQTFFLNTSA